MIPGYIVRDGMFLRSLLESVVTEPMETAFTIPFLRCNLCATFRFPHASMREYLLKQCLEYLLKQCH